MSDLSNRRVAYFNGGIVPEGDVLLPFRDRGFKYGDAVFDMTRTFGHRIFRLREHVDRLYRSLKYARIDPGIGPEEMIEITHEVLQRNLHLLGENDDYWVGQRVSRGIEPEGGDLFTVENPTVIVECNPLPLKPRARLFRDGIDVVIPSIRRVPPEALSPNAKTHNYLNLVLADLEAKAGNPEAWAIVLDVNGNLCEGLGSNIFLVRDGVLCTPREQFVLAGISRATVIELAEEEGIEVIEDDLSPFDAYTAEECFLTSTSLCLCPVRRVNGTVVGRGAVPGPVTRRLTEAYIRLVDHDFVRQYLDRLAT